MNIISDVLNKFIVKPSTVKAPGIGGFVFDVIGDDEFNMSSDITDNYIESNYSTQDHIALRPVRFTLRGYQGELKNIVSSSAAAALSAITSLSSLASFSQGFSAQAAQAYAKISGIAAKVSTVVSKVQSLYSIFAGIDNSSTEQQKAYNYFLNLWYGRILCSVQSPWAVLDNMAIESVNITQRDQNKFVSEFSVTFKQIRIVDSATSDSNDLSLFSQATVDKVGKDRVADMISGQSFRGITSGQTVDSAGNAITTSLLAR